MSFASIGRRREEPCTPDDEEEAPSRAQTPSAARTHRNNNDNDNNNDHHADHQHENDDDDEDEWLFSCRCESAKAVTTLLSCLQQQHQHPSSHHSSSSTMTTTTPLDRRDVTPSPHHRRGGGPRNSTNAASSSSNTTIQPVLVFCSPTHLTFHVHGKVCQSSVDMPAGLFSQFAIFPNQQHRNNSNHPHDHDNDTDEWQASGEFCVNLNTVLDCCQALGTLYLDQTKLGWSYNVTKEMLQIELMMNETSTTPSSSSHHGAADGEATSRHPQQQQPPQQQQNHSTQVLCTAALPGLVPPDWNTSAASSLALAFRSSPMSARIIVPSSILREAMTELELVPAAALTTVQVTFSLPQGLQLSVVGPTSECLVTLPTSHARGRGAKVTMELLLPPPAPAVGRQQPPQHQQPQVLCHVYPWNSWRNAMKALDIATETCLSMNQHGMMAIQHQVILMGDDSHPCFCDYIMCCLDDEDDDDDEAGEEEEHGETMDSQTTTSLPAAAAAGRGISQDSSASSFSLGWNRNRDATQESASPGNNNLLRPIRNDRRDRSEQHVDDDDEEEEEEWNDGGQRQHHHHENDGDDDDDVDDRDMDDAALVPPAPLFGSVLRMVQAEEPPELGHRRPTSSSASSMRQRRRLRRPTSDLEDRSSSTSSSHHPRSTRSRAHNHDNHRRHGQNDDDDDDENDDDDMPLDITENDVSSPARTRQRKGGERGCSSPEIVYGK